MTQVFVDVGTAVLAGADDAASLDAGAIRSLRLLAESGHEVVLVTGGSGGSGTPPGPLAAVAADAVGAVPERPTAQAWYLTADVERCRGTSARLRTVLIGAAPPPGSIHRCDSAARDLQAAVMEILASEAMPPVA